MKILKDGFISKKMIRLTKRFTKKIKIDNLAFRKFGNPNLHVVTILNLK